MIPPSANLARATARSIAARQRLASTLVDLQERLAPRRLIREGLDELVVSAAELRDEAVAAVRQRPGQVIGVVAAIIMLLARDRIADLLAAAGRTAVKPLRRRQVEHPAKPKPRKDRP